MFDATFYLVEKGIYVAHFVRLFSSCEGEWAPSQADEGRTVNTIHHYYLASRKMWSVQDFWVTESYGLLASPWLQDLLLGNMIIWSRPWGYTDGALRLRFITQRPACSIQASVGVWFSRIVSRKIRTWSKTCGSLGQDILTIKYSAVSGLTLFR